MTRSTCTPALFAFAGLAILALAALSAPVTAQQEEWNAAKERQDERKAERLAAKETHQAEHEKFKETCADPASENVARRCEEAKQADGKMHKARRAANALVHAIASHEKRLERLEARAEKINATLAGGNLTDEVVAKLEGMLAKNLEKQDRTEAKVAKLKARLEELKAKWDEVKTHVAEKQAQRAQKEKERAEKKAAKDAAKAES